MTEELKLTKLTKTCDWMPSQWEAELNNGKYLHGRYRMGDLDVTIHNSKQEFDSNHSAGKTIYRNDLWETGEYAQEILKDDTMSDEVFIMILKKVGIHDGRIKT